MGEALVRIVGHVVGIGDDGVTIREEAGWVGEQAVGARKRRRLVAAPALGG